MCLFQAAVWHQPYGLNFILWLVIETGFLYCIFIQYFWVSVQSEQSVSFFLCINNFSAGLSISKSGNRFSFSRPSNFRQRKLRTETIYWMCFSGFTLLFHKEHPYSLEADLHLICNCMQLNSKLCLLHNRGKLVPG